MTPGRAYWVTPVGEEEPYRVTIVPQGGGWRASVERGGRTWRFSLLEGPAPGLAWIGDRPCRWAWEGSDEENGRLVLDGVPHGLAVESDARRRARALGTQDTISHTARDVRAPMPGLILAVEVVEGQTVRVGDGIAIIEAMKMENEITAPITGTVRGVAIRSGVTVEGNTLLCRIEPLADETST